MFTSRFYNSIVQSFKMFCQSSGRHSWFLSIGEKTTLAGGILYIQQGWPQRDSQIESALDTKLGVKLINIT